MKPIAKIVNATICNEQRQIGAKEQSRLPPPWRE
jgi:hypothetical protein